jgi:hypothetical protein
MTSEFWNKKIRGAANQLAGNEMMGWGEWMAESFSYSVGMMKRRLKRGT